MRDLDGRTAVITGGAGAIGLAMARALGAEGMQIVLADVEQRALDAAARDLEAEGVDVLAVTCDVSDAASVEALADHAEERFGRVHVVCNNAGVVTPHDAWGPLEDWEWVLGVDLWGVIHGVHTFVPRILAPGEPGHVVNTASVAGILTFPGIPSYSVAKQGVVAISESLLHSLADEPIGVSVLCPGAVRSGIGTSERNRPGRPADAPEPERAREWAPETLEADEVAQQVLDAIRTDTFWVFPHDHYVEMHHERALSMREGTPPPPAATPR